MNYSFRFLRVAGLFGLVLVSVGTGQAQTTNNFTNAASANWTVASAWSLGVPTATQDVYYTNVTAGNITVRVTTNAVAKSLTVGGSGGTATVAFSANQSLTLGGDLTLASGAGAANFTLENTNITVTLNGGRGSIVNGGGTGLASLFVQGGFSNSLGLLNASVESLTSPREGR